MSIFLDTGILVAEANEDDSLHHKAVEILKRIETGMYGNWVCTSDYVFDEALTLAFARTGNTALSKNLAKRLLASKGINLLYVNEDTFKDSVAAYLDQDSELSFTDCTTVELMKQNDITFLATFDDGFKKISGIKAIGD